VTWAFFLSQKSFCMSSTEHFWFDLYFQPSKFSPFKGDFVFLIFFKIEKLFFIYAWGYFVFRSMIFNVLLKFDNYIVIMDHMCVGRLILIWILLLVTLGNFWFCFSSHNSIIVSSFSLVHNLLSTLGFILNLEAFKLVFTFNPNPKPKGWERELKFTTWKDPNFWEVLILKPWKKGPFQKITYERVWQKNIQFFSSKNHK
jgi:hypothetical protein